MICILVLLKAWARNQGTRDAPPVINPTETISAILPFNKNASSSWLTIFVGGDEETSLEEVRSARNRASRAAQSEAKGGLGSVVTTGLQVQDLVSKMATQCVIIDIRGHGNEIFDRDYRDLLRSSFTLYGEDNVHLFTDASPFEPLRSVTEARVSPLELLRAFEEAIRLRPALRARARMARDADTYRQLQMWCEDGPESLCQLLPPFLRTLFSDRCSGNYVDSASALKSELESFTSGLCTRIAGNRAPTHVFWASHGNYLESPALDSVRGRYGVVALRSAEETASIADVSLDADWIATALIDPLATAIASVESPLLWTMHCCWSSGIVTRIAEVLRASRCPARLPSGLCLVAEKPA